MNFDLIRVSTSLKGTFGTLIYEDVPFVITLERPWNNNQDDISCIPIGSYICNRIQSPKFGETFEVLNVLNRDHILFHKGNIITNTKGCILVAEAFNDIDTVSGVTESEHGFNEFMKKLKGLNQFNLNIYWAKNLCL